MTMVRKSPLVADGPCRLKQRDLRVQISVELKILCSNSSLVVLPKYFYITGHHGRELLKWPLRGVKPCTHEDKIASQLVDTCERALCIQLTCPYGTCICRWLCSNLILCPAASYGCVSVDMPQAIMHIALSCGVTIRNRHAHSITVRISFRVQTLATTSTLCECCRHREA